MFHGTQSELGPGWWLRNAGLLSVRDSGPQGGAPGGGPGLGVTVCGGVGCRVTNKGFCRLSTDCHPELLPPLGAGWRGGFTGRAQRAGGLPASSQAGRVSARGGPGSLPEGPPLGFPDEETEARGRRQGLGSALGFAALSGRGACCLEEAPGWLGVCVCGGVVPGLGQGRPLSEPRCAALMGGRRGSVAPTPQPHIHGVIFARELALPRERLGTLPDLQGVDSRPAPPAARSLSLGSAFSCRVLSFSITRYLEGHLQELRP